MTRRQGWMLISAIEGIGAMMAAHYGYLVIVILLGILCVGAAFLAVWETE